MKRSGPWAAMDWALLKCFLQSGMSITSTISFIDVRTKMSYSIAFLQTSLVSEVKKKKKKTGVTDFISEIKRVEN